MHTVLFTIKAGQSKSELVRLNGAMPAALKMPAVWTAAGLTLIANGGPVYFDTGGEYQAVVAAGRYVTLDSLDPTARAGIDTLQLRSGTAGTPVNQAQDAAIEVYMVSL